MSSPKPKPPPPTQHLPLEVFSKRFRPLAKRVALRRHAKDQMAPGSKLLYRPEQRLKNSQFADVLALGNDCRQGLKRGDVVVISTFSDSDRVYDGERVLVLPEDEIMGVVEA